MKYAKYRSHDKNTILPDPSLWRHKPESVIIEICNSIAEYPHLVKSFAPKNQDIDENYIEYLPLPEFISKYQCNLQNLERLFSVEV